VNAAGAVLDDATEVAEKGKGIVQDSEEDTKAKEADAVKNMVDGSK